MQRPADLQRVPGVFALLHTASAMAYVNETKDLKQRAMLWDAHLRGYENGGLAPAKDFPKYPSDEWLFWVSGKGQVQTRDELTRQGWRLINSYKPRRLYVVKGVEGSVGFHAKANKLNVHTVYKRMGRGMLLEQALGLTDLPPMDKRELAISQMRVQIESDTGGLLTYDEAIQIRPAIGDVREKIKRLRKKNPDVTRVRLSEIPT